MAVSRKKVKESNLWHKFLKKIGFEKEPKVKMVDIKQQQEVDSQSPKIQTPTASTIITTASSGDKGEGSGKKEEQKIVDKGPEYVF